jgi:hypothetical protein
MSDDNRSIAGRKPEARSRISNGSKLLMDIDGRSKWARRFADILYGITADLGGDDNLSEGQRQLIRRCALLAVECEGLEGDAAAGDTIDLFLYGQMTDRLGRALQRLGIRRSARDITNSIDRRRVEKLWDEVNP